VLLDSAWLMVGEGSARKPVVTREPKAGQFTAKHTEGGADVNYLAAPRALKAAQITV